MQDIRPNVQTKSVTNKSFTINDSNEFKESFDKAQQALEGLESSVSTIELTPGPQGIQGEQGLTGNDGFQGDQGLIGPEGIKGDQGIAGPQGIKGDIGDQGIQGLIGLKGDTGSNGSQGDKGDTGEQGLIGPQGEIGSQGIQGLIGLKGDIGDQGIQGLTGDNGLQGLKGDTGDQGLNGDQGIQGPIGLKGDTGNTGLQGTTGSQGIQGLTGLQGDTGLKGDKGNIGDQGIQGIQGPIGLQGANGITGKSAYQTAVDNGYVGTESEWNAEFTTDFDEDHFGFFNKEIEGVQQLVFQPKAEGLLSKLQALPSFQTYIMQIIDGVLNAPPAESLDLFEVATSTFANVAPDDRGEYKVTFTNLLTGDYLLVFANRPTGAGNLTVPAGWVQLFLDSRVQILGRERQAGDPLIYDFYKMTANLYARNGLVAVAIRGFEGSGSIQAIAGTLSTGTVGGVITVNSVTVDVDDEYIAIACVADQNDINATHTYSDGFESNAKIIVGSYDQVISIGSKSIVNGGISGTTSIISAGNPEAVMILLKKNKV